MIAAHLLRSPQLAQQQAHRSPSAAKAQRDFVFVRLQGLHVEVPGRLQGPETPARPKRHWLTLFTARPESQPNPRALALIRLQRLFKPYRGNSPKAVFVRQSRKALPPPPGAAFNLFMARPILGFGDVELRQYAMTALLRSLCRNLPTLSIHLNRLPPLRCRLRAFSRALL
jgi:hypothetical protein